jgi:hypothetical protein
MSRLRKITAPERTIVPKSLKAPKSTDSIISLQPLCPTLKFNSLGYQNETGEVVRRASAKTWERTRRKQSRGLIFGIFDQHLQALDAIKAINKANKRL